MSTFKFHHFLVSSFITFFIYLILTVRLYIYVSIYLYVCLSVCLSVPIVHKLHVLTMPLYRPSPSPQARCSGWAGSPATRSAAAGPPGAPGPSAAGTAAGGVRSRKRTCTNPEPKYGGQTCMGAAQEYQECNVTPCPGIFMFSH